MVSEVSGRTRLVSPVAAQDALGARSVSRAGLAVSAHVVPVALGLTFFAVSTWLAFARHAAFNTGRFDLEIYTQVVWNTANGRPFETTLLKTNLNHLAEHVALVLVPISWLYRVIPDPRLLLAIQQLVLALLGVPIYLYACRRLDSKAQASIALACFYATPALAGIALDDFHAVAIAALPVAVAAWLILVDRPRLGAAFALAALPMEEETALVVAGLGVLLFVRRSRRLGTVVTALAAAWLALAVFVVMPSFHDQRTLELVDGNRTLGHFSELREDPVGTIRRLIGERGRDAAEWVVVPTAGLGLLAPQALLPAGPALGALLLQDRDDTFGRHWVAPMLGVLWLATVAGLGRLAPGRRRQIGMAVLATGTAISFGLVSPLPGGGTFNREAIEPTEQTPLLERAIDRIPPSSVVVASPNVVAHLANRPEAYVFPIDSHYAEALGWRKKRPDFYVLDLTDELTTRATNSERLNPLNADRPYHVWSAGRKVLVLSDEVASPTRELDARFGDRLLLKGYDLLPAGDGREARLVLHWERYAELRGRYDRDLTIYDAAGTAIHYEEDLALSAVYGSNKWRPGQTILDEISLPPASEPLRIRVAWVAQEKRLPFRLADGSGAFEFVVDPRR